MAKYCDNNGKTLIGESGSKTNSLTNATLGVVNEEMGHFGSKINFYFFGSLNQLSRLRL